MKIVLFIVIVICIIYIFTLIPAYAKINKEQKLFEYLFNNCIVANTVVCLKDITDINLKGYLVETKKVYYRFTATDGKTYEKELPDEKLFDEGEEIRVYYNQKNPNENCTDKISIYLKNEENKLIRKIIIPNLIIFVCFVVIIIP